MKMISHTFAFYNLHIHGFVQYTHDDGGILHQSLKSWSSDLYTIRWNKTFDTTFTALIPFCSVQYVFYEH